MFKLSASNTVWKASLFRPLSYNISRDKISNRGLVRFLKAKKIKLKARWAQEKAERQARGDIYVPPPQDISVDVLPDVPKRSFTFLENPENLFNREELNQNVQSNLTSFQQHFPMGLNDIGSFLGYRSGIQKQHFANVLQSLLDNEQLTIQEIEEKLVSFIRLAKTLKLHDLFTQDHFAYMVLNHMVAAIDSLLQLQKECPNNIFTPQLAAILIKYVSDVPDAFFLLQNLKYCSVITEGIRPTQDSASIDQKLLYYIFDPKVMKSNDVLPIAHSIMYIFPETFIRVVNIQGLFVKEVLSISLADAYDEEVENRRFSDLAPEVYDEDEMKIRVLEQQIEERGLGLEEDSEEIAEMAEKLMIIDGEEEPEPTLVQAFGDVEQEETEKRYEKLYREGRITEEQRDRMELQETEFVIDRSEEQGEGVQEPREFKLDPRRFDPNALETRFHELSEDRGLTPQQQQMELNNYIWDKLQFQNDRAESEEEKEIQQINAENRERAKHQNQILTEIMKTVTNQEYYAAKEAAKKKLRSIKREFLTDQEDISFFNVLHIPELMVEAARKNDELGRENEGFIKRNPNYKDYQLTEEEEIQEVIHYPDEDGEVELGEQEMEGINEGEQEEIVGESEWGNPSQEEYNVTETPKVIENPKELRFKELPNMDPSTQELITEEIDELETDVNQIDPESAVETDDELRLDIEKELQNDKEEEGEYSPNPFLQEMIMKYTDQDTLIVRFMAEAFFNTPDVEHGLKSVNLFYLIMYRLTHYAQTLTAQREMNIKDLLALGTSNWYYEDLFTNKLSEVLHTYSINNVNIGELYDNLVNKQSFSSDLLFEPVIVTDYDRDFYSPNKIIKYGKFEDEVAYKAEPEQYLTREQIFESEENRANTETSQSQIRDIVDAYTQKRTQGGYTSQTLNLMESVLSRSSNGMYKLFKKTLSQHSGYKGQLIDQLKTQKIEGLNSEQLSLLGLSEMTSILYDKSIPLQQNEMLEAAFKRNLKENTPVDAILQINQEMREEAGAKEGDFFVPEYQKYGESLKYKVVEPYSPQLSDLNKSMIAEDLKRKGRLQLDDSVDKEYRDKREVDMFDAEMEKLMNSEAMLDIQKQIEEAPKEEEEMSERKREKKRQWHADKAKYDHLYDEAFDLMCETDKTIPRHDDGSLNLKKYLQVLKEQQEAEQRERMEKQGQEYVPMPVIPIEAIEELNRMIDERQRMTMEEEAPKKPAQPKKERKKFVSQEESEKRDKKLEENEKRVKKEGEKERPQGVPQKKSKQKRIVVEREEEDNWYQRRDDSIMDILSKVQEKEEPENQEGKASKSVHNRVDDPFDPLQPQTPQREQTKHDKRAAHEARKQFKRRDTEPDLTDKERKQALPFRRDKQKNLDDNKTPRNNFSTMKPLFKFSTIKRQSSSFNQIINSSPTLEEACTQIKNIFRRNNNSETLKELMRIPDLMHFKTGTQCALAMFFYYEGLPLAESNNLKGTFSASMGEIEVDYNKYLKTTLFDFELGDQVYIKLLEHLKVNFNRGLYKKVLAHLVRYSNMISFELATEIASFVSEANIPMTHLEFVNLVTLNDIRMSLSTLMVLLAPISNYAQTSKDVYTLYKNNMSKSGWALSIQPLQNYIIKLNRAGETEHIAYMVEDLRAIILSRKFKLTDKNVSSEDNKRLQNEFKNELKADELKYVIETAGVLGFTGAFEKAEELFDQFKLEKPELNKEEIKTGLYCYTMNQQKLQGLLDIINKNKEFQTADTYVRVLQPIKKTIRNKMFLDKVLETFIYSGIIQKSLTSQEINQTVEAFIRSKNTNSYPRFLEHLLKYQLKLDQNSYRLFYNVIKEAHTTADSKRMIVNLLDIIFNKDRDSERKHYVLTREREEEKKKKLDELKENQLKRIKSNREELEKMSGTVEIKQDKPAKQETKKTVEKKEAEKVPAQVPQIVDAVPVKQQQLPKQSKKEKGKKKEKKSKDQEKLARVMKKEDQKAKGKLYQEEEPQYKRKSIIPQELRLAVTPKQMRRGGRKKFFFLATTKQEREDDDAAREAIKMKKKRQ